MERTGRGRRSGRGRRVLAGLVLLGTTATGIGATPAGAVERDWLGRLSDSLTRVQEGVAQIQRRVPEIIEQIPPPDQWLPPIELPPIRDWLPIPGPWTPPEPPSDACGPKLLKSEVWGAGEEHWDCVLIDDFDGTELDRSVWQVQTTAGSGFGVGGECFVDSPDNIAVSEGSLKLSARRVPEFTCSSPKGAFPTTFTGGSIFTREDHDRTYGRFEIRARMPQTTKKGLHFAFWLWPRSLTNYSVPEPQEKWANGEIDVMEWYSLHPNLGVPFLHYAHTYIQVPDANGELKWVPNDPNITAWGPNCYVGDASQWHTYTLEWTPSVIRVLYDGKVCLENTNWTPRNTTMPGPFDKPFMTSLTQAMGALGSGNQADSTVDLPGTAEVDYLKIWE